MSKLLHVIVFISLLFSPHVLKAQTWSPVFASNQVLWDAFVLNASNAWAVGNSGTIVRWDGASWVASTPLSTVSQRLGVWAIDMNNVYVVGSSTGQQIHRFNGTTWENLVSTTNWWGTGLMRTVWASSANNVWVSGGALSGVGRVFQWNGASWTNRNQNISGTFSANRIWGTDANNIWVVGSTGADNTGVIYKWNGSSWDVQVSGVPAIRGIWGTSPTNMWAVGGTGNTNPGQIYKLIGNTWVLQMTTTTTLNHINGSNESNIWAVGNGGAIHYYNGTSWTAQTSGRTDHLYAVGVGKTGSNKLLAAVGEGSVTVNPLLVAQLVLPLTWNSFTYRYNGNDLILNWTTSSEINTRAFEVEHKLEDGGWSLLGKVAAAGNSVTTRNYSYKHSAPKSGKNYYRIKQTDLDGASTYSAIVSFIAEGDNQSIRINSNPVINGKLRLTSAGNEWITIYDLQGKERLKRKIAAGETIIDVAGWPGGTYVLKSNLGAMKFVL